MVIALLATIFLVWNAPRLTTKVAIIVIAAAVTGSLAYGVISNNFLIAVLPILGLVLLAFVLSATKSTDLTTMVWGRKKWQQYALTYTPEDDVLVRAISRGSIRFHVVEYDHDQHDEIDKDNEYIHTDELLAASYIIRVHRDAQPETVVEQFTTLAELHGLHLDPGICSPTANLACSPPSS